MGRRPEAAAAYGKALAILEPLAPAQSPDLAALYAAADAYFAMGELSKTEAELSAGASGRQRTRWIEARNWYRKSAEAWRRIPNPAMISTSGFACGNPRDVARMISVCDAALRESCGRAALNSSEAATSFLGVALTWLLPASKISQAV